MLVPFTLDLIDAALNDRTNLERVLAAHVPADWPGPDYLEMLPLLAQTLAHDPSQARWSRLLVHRVDRMLIGDAGCHAPPDANGTVEIGYSITSAYRNAGYATEAVRALIRWLFDQPGVTTIIAECARDNIGSVRVLEKLGMQQIQADSEMLRWKMERRTANSA
jgi:ribosomal-protein-alanine N-acetyltransferase